MITIQMGRRGQITLPSEVRRQFGLQEGDRIAIESLDDRLILRPITQTLLDLRGSVPVASEQDFTEIRRQALEAKVQKVARDEP